ncbi:ribosomal protein L7/L12 [Sphingomonas sp. S2-65]|uniref:ribosomal protein L7/L12 n=1 Tax=Sphingomonas sp. S2-65 TaxID=2903960 RepID=UPI0039B6F51F
MFVPVPIVIVLGLIFFAMAAQIIRGSRKRDPLLGGPPRAFGPRPVSVRQPSSLTPPATLPPKIESEVRALLEAGGKIEAIKLVRDSTRLGLKEAKDLVEAL